MTFDFAVLQDAFLDALTDSLKMLPLLFIIYVLIELVEEKWGSRLSGAIAKAGKLGPVIGAVAGIIPQCGLSVVGAALYNQRLLTVGTFAAVYLATSDEAIPVILSQPGAAPLLVPLIGSKLVVAIAVGYALDAVLRKRNQQVWEHDRHFADGTDDPAHHHETALEEHGCCGHEPAAPHQHLTARTLLWHPLVHTAKVFVFIFLVSLVLALAFAIVGQEAIAQALAGHTLLQPVLAALIGLIPNCAASVAVTELYLSDVITFGACLAGLLANGGLALLVLFKEGNRREALIFTAGMLVIAVAAGMLVQTLLPALG